MSFYYPLGLLGLIGVPILIIIYIIKSKYTEQTIASTYLWELSERFLKKRKRISMLTGIITLILQILAVVAASLLIAHPVFTIPNSANDYYFILDASASMNMVQDGTTRFKTAQDRINSLIDGSRDGSKFSLAMAGNTSNIVFEQVSDKEQAKSYVNGLSAGWNSAECSSAMVFVQEYFDANSSADVYLVTDKEYETNDNLTLINVSAGESNYAFHSYGYENLGGIVTASGEVVSYKENAELTVELIFIQADGTAESVARVQVNAEAGEPSPFKVSYQGGGYIALQLKISNADALEEDNTVILYDEAVIQSRKVLLIDGDNDSSYIRHALINAGLANVDDVTTPKKYEEQLPQGYGMYVFNGYSPETLPRNCAVWLINAIDGKSNGSGISFRDKQEPRDEDDYYTPNFTRDSSSQAKAFTKGLVKREIALKKYAKYGVPRKFTTLMENNGDPLISVGLNDNNDRQVVFAFKIGDSNFGMSEDFLILTKNLMEYSFPQIIEETSYNCGETLSVNVVPGCQNISVTTPSDSHLTLDTIDAAVCEVSLTETGTYTITVSIANQEDTVLYVFARVPEEESRSQGGETIYLNGTKEYNYSDGFYDKLLIFFILIVLLLLADWGIYCYEQYQLR